MDGKDTNIDVFMAIAYCCVAIFTVRWVGRIQLLMFMAIIYDCVAILQAKGRA